MFSMTRNILGLVGRQSSGKGTLAAYLKDTYSAATFRFRDPLADVLKRLALDLS